jgi:hypothetical protein
VSIEPIQFTDDSHDGGHIPPPGTDETWQESWYTGWFDPVAGAAGFYHLGLQRNRGIADLWNWTAVDGEVAGKYQSLSIPLPEDDLSDLRLPGVHIQTLKPLLSYQVDTKYSSGVASTIIYEAFTPPFSFSLTDHTTDLGHDHYESCGRVRGSIEVGDRQIDVQAYAFQDHSWGPRVYASLLSHRWSYAVFGEDLFLSVAKFTGEGGTYSRGYVYDNDHFYALGDLAFNTIIADDGHSPLGCDMHIDALDGSSYRVRGEVAMSSISSHNDGYFATDGFTNFTCGERRGTGILEVNELRSLLPHHRKQLGLE